MSTIRIEGPMRGEYREVLTPEALDFLAALHDQFRTRRHDLLAARQENRRGFSNGRYPAFRRDTEEVRRDDNWRVAPPAPGLEDRRVEITGPVSARMAINALNSGAKVWLADLEDATSPTWDNIVGGQGNLRRAVRGELEFTSAAGKFYRVTGDSPTIVVRPRGWHLAEKHLRHVDATGTAHSTVAGLVDFGLYFFHNAAELVARGRGPYFYLPKLESAEEARLWNDIFLFAQDYIGMERGTIRATVLIETLTAAFEMEEILYELREHSAGLNAGRWDYIFSLIKNFRHRASFVMPDRENITMTVPFMRAYTELLVRTCHRRGAHAIGGMSAFIPDRRNPEVTERALAQVKADKSREAADGFDGSWVAHPDLIPTAIGAFDAVLGNRPNQVDRLREDVNVRAADLLDVSGMDRTVTERGLRTNIRVALGYIDAWIGGLGAVAINNLMEDAATAEISRSQIWHWIRHEVELADGRQVTAHLVERMIGEEQATMDRRADDHLDEAREVLMQSALGEELPTFFTIPAYTQFMVQRYPAESAA